MFFVFPKEWYNAHEDDPYPTVDDKERLAVMTGLTTKQVDYWFWNKLSSFLFSSPNLGLSE